MTFYHRTLYHASGITHSVIGNFLDEEKEDIIVSTGRVLKLLRFDLGNTRSAIQTLISRDTYDIISSLSKFRRKYETKDWIIIAADSGRVTILFVDAETMEFQIVYKQRFRVQNPKTLPVQHLAVDSQGHVIFTAAMEEVKQFWIFHGSDYIPSYSLTTHEKNTLIYDIAVVDINSENIVIAYLATAYKELHFRDRYEKKRWRPSLIFSEVHEDKVVEIKRINCLDYANSLISVPGERGVLVCAEDFIAFYSLDSSTITRCSIPKRIMDLKAGIIFACFSRCSNPNLRDILSKADVITASSPQKSIYYFAQTEQGDIFRIQLVVNEFGVNEIILKYFITLPVASALCTFKSGFLFVASEFGDHHIYKIADIERLARVHPSFSSALALPKGKPFFFMHRNLRIESVAEIESMSPIMLMEFEPLSSMRPRMCLALGQASLSKLKISKVERDVTYQCRLKIEKERDETPLRMWVIESTKSISEVQVQLLVVSFEASTAVYSLESASDYAIQKMEPKLFASNTNTLGCAKTGKDAIVQVCPEGVCLITGGRNMLIHDTKKDAIQECAMNKNSLVIALENKQLNHHKIDQDGRVMKSEIPRLLNGPITCMLLSDKGKSNQLLAVGVSIPSAKSSSASKVIASVSEVHLFMIGLSTMNFLCLLKVDNCPYSFLFMNGESNLQSLLVGCENGKLLTLAVEETAKSDGATKHELKVIKTEEIGSEDVQLLCAPILGKILAVSNHSWFKESVTGDFLQLKSDISPCICIMLDEESVATIFEDELRVFILEDLQPKPPVTIPLEYTPKKFAVDFCTGNIFIIETDSNSYTDITKQRKQAEFRRHMEAEKLHKEAKKSHVEAKGPQLPPLENIPKSWASLLRVVNLTGVKAKDVFKLPFDQNEAAFSLCRFNLGDDDLLLVGVAKNVGLSFKTCTEASIHMFKILDEGKTIRFLHKTDIISAPLAMCYYEEKILIGIGRKLALYCVKPKPLEPESLELELLCEKEKCVSSSITDIYPVDNRILVSDSQFGISYVVYVPSDKCFHLLQKDVFPTEVTAASILSDNQMARATKSRDIFIVELGTVQNRDMSKVYKDNEPPFTISEEKVLGSFHVGEVVTSMQVFQIFPEEPVTVVYTTLSGSVGILSQILWQKDAEILSSLYEALLKLAKEIDRKTHNLPIFPSNHFRSRHYRRKNVIDGDFLDEFLKLDVELQKAICNEIIKKEEAICNEMEDEDVTEEASGNEMEDDDVTEEASGNEMEDDDVTEILTLLEKMRRESRLLDFQF